MDSPSTLHGRPGKRRVGEGALLSAHVLDDWHLRATRATTATLETVTLHLVETRATTVDGMLSGVSGDFPLRTTIWECHAAGGDDLLGLRS